MVKVIDDQFMVCSDCAMAIANDDYTGLDAYLDEEEAEMRMNHIKESIASVEGWICIGDPENDIDFSVQSCDCCKVKLAGYRHQMVVMNK